MTQVTDTPFIEYRLLYLIPHTNTYVSYMKNLLLNNNKTHCIQLNLQHLKSIWNVRNVKRAMIFVNAIGRTKFLLKYCQILLNIYIE